MTLSISKTEVRPGDGNRLRLDNGVQLLHLNFPDGTRDEWIKVLQSAEDAPPQGVVDWKKTVKYQVLKRFYCASNGLPVHFLFNLICIPVATLVPILPSGGVTWVWRAEILAE